MSKESDSVFKFPEGITKSNDYFIGHCHKCRRSYWATGRDDWVKYCGHDLTKKRLYELGDE